MKLGIIKRVFAFSCAAVLVFSMSGCVSNSSTDNAKSLGSSGDDYNITEFEEEEVIVDQSIKISFSEKGTVRYEGTGTNLIDFGNMEHRKVIPYILKVREATFSRIIISVTV